MDHAEAELDRFEAAKFPQIATKPLAFQIDYADIKQNFQWLKQHGIMPVPHKAFEPFEPVVRPMPANCSVYFHDPDGNLLQLIRNLPEAPRKLLLTYRATWEKSSSSIVAL